MPIYRNFDYILSNILHRIEMMEIDRNDRNKNRALIMTIKS